MRIEPTAIPGVHVVEIEPHVDERGYFARTWCRREFEAAGLDVDVVQCNVSHNVEAGIVRGLHLQAEPHAEVKLVQVTRGAIYDVVVDVRRESETYKQWVAVELSAENGRMIYVPKGCLHGYQTLVPETDIFYQVTAFYHPELERGARYDDPAFGITWPLEPRCVSPKDLAYGPFEA